MRFPKVAVIILNYNGTQDTRECVESVKKLDYPNFEILLVDNASKDASWKDILKKHPDVQALENPKNLGYAGGNNAGIRQALEQGCDYVFILNNDTTVEPDSLRKLIEAGEKLDQATLLAPKVCFYDKPFLINSCGASMDWFRLKPRLGYYGKNSREVDSIFMEMDIFPGSALLLKRKLLEQVGEFDEDFFLIHEDADLCFRNTKAGFKNILVPGAVVYHKESKTLSKYPFLTQYYNSRNFLRLTKKAASFPEKIASKIGLAALVSKNTLRFLFAKSPEREEMSGFFEGVRDYFLGRMGPYEAKK